jgi:hypothetical protein
MHCWHRSDYRAIQPYHDHETCACPAERLYLYNGVCILLFIFSRTRGEALLEHGVFHAHLVVAGHVHGVHVHLAAGKRVEGDVHADVQLVA